jgi:hypothetical protein
MVPSAAIERRRHLLSTDGWKIKGKIEGIVGHGGRGNSVERVE